MVVNHFIILVDSLMDIETILTRLSRGAEPSPAEAAALLGPSSRAQRLRLLSVAEARREVAFGRRVELCAIINARSGRCREDCAFCAQSIHHATPIKTYPLLSNEDILAAARRAKRAGVSRFSLVTSGRTVRAEDMGPLCAAIEGVAALGLKPCASLGLLREADLRRLRAAGLERYHHNLETAESFYPQICITHTWSERLATLKAARRAGLSLCCGGVFGLGESDGQRVELILSLKRLEVDSVAVNFLNPIPGTPLSQQPLMAPWTALSLVAVIRLLLPAAEIRTCGGRLQTLGPLTPLQYLAGANATMTGDYLTTAGPRPEADWADIQALGLEVARAAEDDQGAMDTEL